LEPFPLGDAPIEIISEIFAFAESGALILVNKQFNQLSREIHVISRTGTITITIAVPTFNWHHAHIETAITTAEKTLPRVLVTVVLSNAMQWHTASRILDQMPHRLRTNIQGFFIHGGAAGHVAAHLFNLSSILRQTRADHVAVAVRDVTLVEGRLQLPPSKVSELDLVVSRVKLPCHDHNDATQARVITKQLITRLTKARYGTLRLHEMPYQSLSCITNNIGNFDARELSLTCDAPPLETGWASSGFTWDAYIEESMPLPTRVTRLRIQVPSFCTIFTDVDFAGLEELEIHQDEENVDYTEVCDMLSWMPNLKKLVVKKWHSSLVSDLRVVLQANNSNLTIEEVVK
jgi:hypothetical protein